MAVSCRVMLKERTLFRNKDDGMIKDIKLVVT